MDTNIIFKSLGQWIKLYGKKLIGVKTQIPSSWGEWKDGAIIIDVNVDERTATFKSISGDTGEADYSIFVGIYPDSFDSLPQENFIRNQVRQRLTSLQKLEI
jgi:hypothetical protein